MSNITVRINDDATLYEQWKPLMRDNYVLAVSISNDLEPVTVYGSMECLGNNIPAGIIRKIHGGKLTGAIFTHINGHMDVDELLTGNMVDCKSNSEALQIATVAGSRITWCQSLCITNATNTIFDNNTIRHIDRADNCKFFNCEFLGQSESFENCVFQACRIRIGHGFCKNANNCVFDKCVFLYNSPFSIIEHGALLTFIACKFHGTGAKNLITNVTGELKMTLCDIIGANFETFIRQASGIIACMGLNFVNSTVRTFIDESNATNITLSHIKTIDSEISTFLGLLTDRGILSITSVNIKSHKFIHSARYINMMLSNITVESIDTFCDQLYESALSFDHIVLHGASVLKFFESVVGSRVEGRTISFKTENLQMARHITNRSDIFIEHAKSSTLKIHKIDIDETSTFNGECQNESA